MKKQLIRLTENDLHKIIKESVKRIMMENKFIDTIRDELRLPIEARKSRMTDEEIMQMLNKHKKEEMDYDQEQLEAEKARETQGGLPHENPNLRSTSAARAYTHGVKNVPMK